MSHVKAKQLIPKSVLQYHTFQRIHTETDASNEGADAVLSRGGVGKDRPRAYTSRSFNRAEKNYSVIGKQLAAIVWERKYFRPYLYSRNFKIVSDHTPLAWIMNVKDPSTRSRKLAKY